jgi:hypothetical protein
LKGEDFKNQDHVEKLASAANMTAIEFLDRFGYLSGTVPTDI